MWAAPPRATAKPITNQLQTNYKPTARQLASQAPPGQQQNQLQTNYKPTADGWAGRPRAAAKPTTNQLHLGITNGVIGNGVTGNPKWKWNC